ncbi:MAG: hypothetical protein ABSG62_08210 [Terracidiphilus sp.]|jgi:hypothetical protein
MLDETMMSRRGIPMVSGIPAQETKQTSQAALAEGCRQMAADIEHEMEAEKWVEALIGDVASDEG